MLHDHNYALTTSTDLKQRLFKKSLVKAKIIFCLCRRGNDILHNNYCSSPQESSDAVLSYLHAKSKLENVSLTGDKRKQANLRYLI